MGIQGTMTLENRMKLSFFVLISFLLLLSLHQWTLLREKAVTLEQMERKRLTLVSQLLMGEAQKHPLDLQRLSPSLEEWAARFGVDRLTVFDPEGQEIADSVKLSVDRAAGLQLSPAERGQVLKGSTLFLHSAEATSEVWRVYTPLRDGEGPTRGIIKIVHRGVVARDYAGSTVTSLLLKLFGLATAMVVGYSFIRTSLVSWRRQRIDGVNKPNSSPLDNGGHPKRDKADFVMDTFQSVVQELKEKEHELERLRSAAEEKVRHVESYNENILRSVSSGVITFNPQQTITTFNLAAERILGMNSVDGVGRSCEEVFGPKNPVYQLLVSALKSEETIARQEFEMIRPDLRKIWVGVSTSLLRDQGDAVIGATFVFTDLTEIRRLQEQIELKKRLTVLGEMSAGIAHEFRNFMGTILGFAKLLSKQLEPRDARQGMIGAIIQELRAMDHLISDLLSFGKHVELNCQPLPLTPFLERIIAQVPVQAGMMKPAVVVDVPGVIPPVYGDELLLRQAFSNLVQNALEAMASGGELRVSARFIPKSTVEVVIKDSGTGIPPENLERIFLPFFTTKARGTGLGLALVHKIVLSHNGRIEVESEEGKGTMFHVYLPTLGNRP